MDYTEELLQKLKNIDRLSDQYPVKSRIEHHMLEAYSILDKIRLNMIAKKLSPQDIDDLQGYFDNHSVTFETFECSNKYLNKYAGLVHKFWRTNRYFTGSKMSRGKLDILISIKTEFSEQKKGWFIQECSKVLNKMEEHIIASNQVYTKHTIYIIKKTNNPTYNDHA